MAERSSFHRAPIVQSGKTPVCHTGDLGSNPGRRILLIFFLLLYFQYLNVSHPRFSMEIFLSPSLK